MPEPTSTPRPTTTPEPTPTPRPTATPTITPEPTPTPKPTLTPTPVPTLDEARNYLLGWINVARVQNELDKVVLGDNSAAQVHAENSLSGCFLSHWGMDGTTPDMRYRLAGGRQYSRENVSGNSFCYVADDNVRSIGDVLIRVKRANDGLLDSPGHRANILDPKHKRVNLGIAWDKYNLRIVQQFEGDYTEYDQEPRIENGLLSLSGRVVNGATLADPERRDRLSVAVFYHPTLRKFNRGHLARTACVNSEPMVASIRRPPRPGAFYSSDEFTREYGFCRSPYDLPADLPEPETKDEARALKDQTRDLSRDVLTFEDMGARITATVWGVDGDSFHVEANIGPVLDERGPGVYTIRVWANINGNAEAVSEYAIFHETEPPDTQYAR